MGKGTSSSSRCCWIHPEGFNPCNPLPLPCAITCRVSQKILIHRDPRVPLLATPEFHPASEGVSQAFLIRICLWKTFGDTKRGFFWQGMSMPRVCPWAWSMGHVSHAKLQNIPMEFHILLSWSLSHLENFGKGESNLRPARVGCLESLRTDP